VRLRGWYQLEGVLVDAGENLQEESGMDWRLGNMRFRGMERALPEGTVWGEAVLRLSVDFDEKPGRGRRVGAIGWFSSGGGDEGRMDGVNALKNFIFNVGPQRKERGKDGEGPLDVK